MSDTNHNEAAPLTNLFLTTVVTPGRRASDPPTPPRAVLERPRPLSTPSPRFICRKDRTTNLQRGDASSGSGAGTESPRDTAAVYLFVGSGAGMEMPY